jgi:hypothetical protein
MSTAAVVLRFVVYTAVVLGLLASLPSLVEPHDISAFKEGGGVEWFQFALISIAAAIFWAGAAGPRPWRALFHVLTALASIAAVRELDSILDQRLAPLGWPAPALVLLAWACFVAARRRRPLADAAGRFVRSAAFGILWAGFILVTTFAQLVGHSDFLQALMGDDYSRAYKRVIEEIAEAFGYLLILIGAVETILLARLRAPAGRPHPPDEPRAAPPGEAADSVAVA